MRREVGLYGTGRKIQFRTALIAGRLIDSGSVKEATSRRRELQTSLRYATQKLLTTRGSHVTLKATFAAQ